MPNDGEEQDRLDLQHHIYSLLLAGELYTAPSEPSPKRALDVEIGIGIWAMDFADKFPNCHVIGTGLSAIQPTFVHQTCSLKSTIVSKSGFIRSLSASSTCHLCTKVLQIGWSCSIEHTTPSFPEDGYS
jgi:hypothetical protein